MLTQRVEQGVYVLNASAKTNLEETKLFLELGPHSIEAEQYFLSAILNEPSRIKTIRKLISSGDFYDPVHSDIYSALFSFGDGHGKPEPSKVASLMKSRVGLDELGGVNYIQRLQERLEDTKVPLEVFAQIIKTMASARGYLTTPAQVWTSPVLAWAGDVAKVGEDGTSKDSLPAINSEGWLIANLVSLRDEALKLSDSIDTSNEYVQYLCSGIK